MRRHFSRGLIAALLVVSAGACASQRPTGAPVVAPQVTLLQTSQMSDVRIEDLVTDLSRNKLSMNYQLQIVNPLDHPIKLVSVEIEAVGLTGAYAMNRVRHAFDRTIAARGTDSIDLRAWVQPLQRDMVGNSDSPVMLRGSARFTSEVGIIRRNFIARGQ